MQDVDLIAKGLGNYDHNEFNRSIRFCLRCGSENLQRCDRMLDREGKPIQGREYWCILCGFSFNVKMSVDWSLALCFFKEHRQHRTMPRYQERYVDPEVISAWKEEYEKPAASITWPSKRGWNLTDKLKAALT